jgi:hypothetical protein
MFELDDIRPDWQQRKAQLEYEKKLEEERIALAHARRRQADFLMQSISSVPHCICH